MGFENLHRNLHARMPYFPHAYPCHSKKNSAAAADVMDFLYPTANFYFYLPPNAFGLILRLLIEVGVSFYGVIWVGVSLEVFYWAVPFRQEVFDFFSVGGRVE